MELHFFYVQFFYAAFCISRLQNAASDPGVGFGVGGGFGLGVTTGGSPFGGFGSFCADTTNVRPMTIAKVNINFCKTFMAFFFFLFR